MNACFRLAFRYLKAKNNSKNIDVLVLLFFITLGQKAFHLQPQNTNVRMLNQNSSTNDCIMNSQKKPPEQGRRTQGVGICKIKSPENPVRSGSEEIKGLNGGILCIVKRPFPNRR
jgi:hypothetical protein